MSSSYTTTNDKPLDKSLLELLHKVRETDIKLYNDMTLAADDSKPKERKCLQWGIDPETGRRFCIRWE